MNFQLYNDKTYTFPLQCKNASGVVQPWPTTGAWPVAVSDNPGSLAASVTYVAPSFKLVLKPMVQASPNISVTVSYIGMGPAIFVADIVADPDLISVAVDASGVTTATQSIPTNTGP